jgi:hypothetical protein
MPIVTIFSSPSLFNQAKYNSQPQVPEGRPIDLRLVVSLFNQRMENEPFITHEVNGVLQKDTTADSTMGNT